MILLQTVSYRGATEVDSTIENDGAQLKKKKKKKSLKLLHDYKVKTL